MSTDALPVAAPDPVPPVRCGSRAGGCAVPPEEAEWLGALLADLRLRLRPAGRVEADLVESLAVLELKLARLDALELRALGGTADEGAARLPSLGTLVRYRTRLLKERSEIDLRLRQLADARRTDEAEPAAAAADLAGLDDLAAMIMAESRPRPPEGEGRGQASAPALNRHERRRREAELRRAA
jgi:hypothetical protein